jgi:uncharacterized protein YndB with AHSA1/START domain
MKTEEKTMITVGTTLNVPVETVWNLWTNPKHIIHWNNASDDWHTPKAENDLRVGGKFLSRMEAKDGSFGFDFAGVYDDVKTNQLISYSMDDGRRVKITFESDGKSTTVTETFDAETENSVELQRTGWQAILDSFKKYVETSDEGKSMHFEITIDAKPEKVYQIMLNEKTYTEWTAEFNPTSRFEGSWEKGAKILFIGTDEDGTEGGMVSRIKENIPNRFVSIEHQGILQNGKEITSGPEVDPWVGGLENYTFGEVNGKTLLLIDMKSSQKIGEDFKSYFLETWPKALKKLKAICEANN